MLEKLEQADVFAEWPNDPAVPECRAVLPQVHATRMKPGRYKNGYACRCRRCEARFWRRHEPDSYWGANARFGQCPTCKVPLRVDWFRTSGQESKRQSCRCGGYAFKHRKGSLFCQHGRAGQIGRVFIGDGSAQAFYAEQAPSQ